MFRLFSFFAVAYAANVNPDVPTTSTTEIPSLQLPCNPIVPACNGTWVCKSPNTPIIYRENYGWLCEESSNVFQLPITELCPYGGMIVNDKCVLEKQAPSWGCPEFSTLSNGHCYIKYPIHCPAGYLYNPAMNGCVLYSRPFCLNETISMTPAPSQRVLEPSMTPAPSKFVQQDPSMTPAPSQRILEPSVTPAPSKFVQQDSSMTPAPSQRILEPSVTPAPSKFVQQDSSMTPAPSQRVLEPSMTPAPSKFVQEEPSMTPASSQRVLDPSVTPAPSQRVLDPSVTPAPSQRVLEPSMTPTTTPTTTSKCECPADMLLEFISTSNTPICIKRIQPIRKENCAEFDADGQCLRWEVISECPVGYMLNMDMCEYRKALDCISPLPMPSQDVQMLSMTPAPSKFVQEESSMTPAPSQRVLEPSMTPAPSKFVQEERSTTPSPTSSQITYMTATLTIDFTNTTATNTTLMQDPAVIDRIKEAIAIMLNVPITKVVIDDIEWVSNGVSTKFHLTARRLQETLKDGLYINYKVMDTVSISSDEYATKVATLAAPLTNILGESVTVASTPLNIVPPPITTTAEELSNSTTPTAIFIIVGSILSIGLIAAAVVYGRKRKNGPPLKSSNMILRNPYDSSDVTKVTILGKDEPSMSEPNKLFNYSNRLMIAHNPMKVRKNAV